RSASSPRKSTTTKSPTSPRALGSRRANFFFNDTATTEIYTLSLHDALPISRRRSRAQSFPDAVRSDRPGCGAGRSEEHTSELQSLTNLVCRLLLEKKAS